MCLLNRCLGRGDVLLLLIFLLRQGLRREVEVVYLLIDVSSESYIIPSSFLLLSKNSLDRSNWIFYFWYQNWEFSLIFFFFNDTATTEIYTLSLHDALPI